MVEIDVDVDRIFDVLESENLTGKDFVEDFERFCRRLIKRIYYLFIIYLLLFRLFIHLFIY